jgi:hypothetical protein
MNIKDFQRKSNYKHYIVMNDNIYFKSFHPGTAGKCYSCAFDSHSLKRQCYNADYIDAYAKEYPYPDTVPSCGSELRDGIKIGIEYKYLLSLKEYLAEKDFIKLIPNEFICCGNHIHISDWVPKNISKYVPRTHGLIQYECPMCGSRSALLEDTGDSLNNLLRAYNFIGIDITRRKCG